MAYNTPETVADYLARFQMEITHRGKGTFTPDHVKYSLTIASGGKDFFTTFESNPHVHGEPTITQVFGALASDAMVVRDYGMDEFVDEFCDGMKPSAAIRAYNSCKETYDWMRDGLYLSNGDLVENAAFEEKYGEDFADCADNFIQDNDDIAGRVNPCAMSVETVRAVYGMGFDAVFLNDWKKELAECDIDPEAVSVDSEAHDMENGRDGLDGNAPEKDAPEKDDRDAQPPVDTDNR